MTISIPDTLTVDNSGKYIMSIRLQSDGFSFSGYIPSVGGSFFYRKASTRGGNLAESFKDFFYSHDFLTWMYKQIRIVNETPFYTLVPEDLYDEKEKTELLRFLYSDVGDFALAGQYEDNRVVYQMNPEVYEFCSRSFITPSFYSHIQPLLVFGGQDSRLTLFSKMYVVIRAQAIDVICFRRGDLRFVNTFRVQQIEDMLYYLLYVWKQLGLDQEKDILSLYGNGETVGALLNTLRHYLRHVVRQEIPSDAYLLGGEMAQAPMDLIALSLCEL